VRETGRGRSSCCSIRDWSTDIGAWFMPPCTGGELKSLCARRQRVRLRQHRSQSRRRFFDTARFLKAAAAVRGLRQSVLSKPAESCAGWNISSACEKRRRGVLAAAANRMWYAPVRDAARCERGHRPACRAIELGARATGWCSTTRIVHGGRCCRHRLGSPALCRRRAAIRDVMVAGLVIKQRHHAARMNSAALRSLDAKLAAPA